MSADRPKSKIQALREQRRRQQMARRWLAIGGIILLAVVAVFALTRTQTPAATPTVVDVGTDSATTPGGIIVPAVMDYPQADDNAMGDPKAPITITEYSDYQCPYCARFAVQTEQQLVETYVKTGKVRFIYRTMGGWIGPESLAAANAAYCAGEQNQYWPYHAIIFANWAGENQGLLTNDRLTEYAGKLDLDMQKFGSCLESGKYNDRANQDQVDGNAAGVEGTPFFLITYTVNGEVKQDNLPGAYPFEDFQAKLDAALAEMGLDK
jgi:protein-disulfide isomerase